MNKKYNLDVLSNVDRFLTSGDRTKVTENVHNMASCISEKDSVDAIKQIMYLMNAKIHMERNSKYEKKFQRSADEIIQNGFRSGCCDSSTLFVSLCRAKHIPAIQIITADISSMKEGIFNRGHFFSGCYLTENDSWIWLNSDKNIKNISEVTLHKLDFNSPFLTDDFLIFALERDYSEYEKNGLKIDSIKNINKIHEIIFNEYKNDLER